MAQCGPKAGRLQHHPVLVSKEDILATVGAQDVMDRIG